MRFPIAPGGIFWSIQGEGAMSGTPMRFVRLAGCSIGCPGCDSDYSVAERLTLEEIAERLDGLPWTKWVWVTGGEPTDHDGLGKLLKTLRGMASVALATAGHKEIRDGIADWISVSPHDVEKWTVKHGNELKLVPGLNGLRLEDVEPFLLDCRFKHWFVQPLEGSLSSFVECMDFVRRRPQFRVSVQVHKILEMP